MKIIVLGGGLVGGVIAKDLAKDGDLEVTVADINGETLQNLQKQAPVKARQADLSKPGLIKELVSDYDMVVGAVPGFLGLSMARQVIEAGKNLVDISFAPEDYTVLDGLAREKGVTALVDCGVAPGMSNILVSYLAGCLDEAQSAEILVGGLPQVRYWPYEYKIVFSAIDVIENTPGPCAWWKTAGWWKNLPCRTWSLSTFPA